MGSESFEKYTQTLPERLSDEEQESLLKIYCATKNEEARELLIVHNLRLAEAVVRNFEGKGDLDDFMQIATIELMRVLDNYDITKGVKFATYAYACMNGKILDTLRNNKKQIESIDFSAHKTYSIVANGDNIEIEEDIIDETPDDYDWVSEIAHFNKLNSYLATLNERDRFFLEHTLCVNGKERLTQRQMAKIQNISLSRVNSKVNKLMRRLREYFICDIPEQSEK